MPQLMTAEELLYTNVPNKRTVGPTSRSCIKTDCPTDGTEYMLDGTDQLLGEDVLPGFSCTLASILG